MRKFEYSNQLDGGEYTDELRAIAISSGIVINQDLSLGLALRLTAPDTSCFSSDAKSFLASALAKSLNTLPDNFDFEWRYVPVFRPDEIAEALDAHPHAGGLVGEVNRETAGYFAHHFETKTLRFYRCYAILTRRFPLPLKERRKRASAMIKRLRSEQDAGRRPSFGEKLARIAENISVQFQITDDLVQYQEAEFHGAVDELMLHARSLAQGLTEAGFAPAACNDDEAIEVLYSFWNRRSFDAGERARPFVQGDDLPLPDYYAHSGFEWDPAGKEVPRGMYFQDGLYHRIISVLRPPGMIGQPKWPHLESMLLGQGPRKIECIVKMVSGDREERLKLLRREIEKAEKAYETSKKKDDADLKRLDQLKAEKSGIEDSLEKTWKAGIYFHIWDATPEGVEEASAEIARHANGLDMKVHTETLSLNTFFRALQPFWTQDHDRYRLFDYTTLQIVGLLPMCGQPTNLGRDSQGKAKPLGALLETATGSVFNLFFHSPRHTANAHAVFCAGSRKGKSTLVCAILMELARYPLRVVIIDLGASYRRFCEALGGSYLEFDLRDRTKKLNPLFIAGNRLPDEDELRARLFTLEQMLCDTERGMRFDRDEAPKINEALRLCYRRNAGREITLSDLLAQFKEMGLTSWSTRLHDWTGDTPKGNLFDGINTVNTASRVTVFDFQKIKDDPELGPVCFHVATNLVGQMAELYPNDIKIAICDEASRYLKKPVTAEFIDQAIRTLAKHGIAWWTMSQNFGDFTKLPVTQETFMTNISTWVFLGQDSPTVCEEIAREKRLSEAELGKLSNLKTVFGQYSELLVIQDTGAGPVTTHCYNISTPLKYAMTTTSPTDRPVIEKLCETMALPDALRAFAARYPKGADIQFAATNPSS